MERNFTTFDKSIFKGKLNNPILINDQSGVHKVSDLLQLSEKKEDGVKKSHSPSAFDTKFGKKFGTHLRDNSKGKLFSVNPNPFITPEDVANEGGKMGESKSYVYKKLTLNSPQKLFQLYPGLFHTGKDSLTLMSSKAKDFHPILRNQTSLLIIRFPKELKARRNSMRNSFLKRKATS